MIDLGQQMTDLPLEVLKKGTFELGIELTDAQIRQFEKFASMLLNANRKFNLTRITDPTEIVTKHFLDSLMCLAAEPPHYAASVIDIGTGAGFPSIPIKIVRPDLNITLMDGKLKKIRFVENTMESLGFENTASVHARAEDLGKDKSHREHYDVAYARALAEMPILVELCLPYVRIGGYLVATKGPETETELNEARELIHELGGVIEKTISTHVPTTDIKRSIIVIRKTTPTPSRYPRSYAKITASKARKHHG
ncbi:MAG: 16S rRNA (guanine(527)-N(7))-methyltransferase RsmG [Armatimonadota bacterium]